MSHLPTTWLVNSFSLNMLTGLAEVTLNIRELSTDDARTIAEGARSAVGHADTAAGFSTSLNRTVKMNRATITLRQGDRALVGQHVGERLPEGVTVKPAGSRIRWLLVQVD